MGIAFQRKLGAGLFGGEGFILQKLEGDGLAFVHAGGTVVERDLGAGETLRLDTGCLVAFERQVDYDIQTVPGIKTALFGGEGLFFATLTGPGKVWDPVASVQPAGEPGLRRGAPDRRDSQGRGLRTRRSGRAGDGRSSLTPRMQLAAHWVRGSSDPLPPKAAR